MVGLCIDDVNDLNIVYDNEKVQSCILFLALGHSSSLLPIFSEHLRGGSASKTSSVKVSSIEWR
jgi:hypothetical protein